MKPQIQEIKSTEVKTFYGLYWPQHQILLDFYDLLEEKQYDYRMVDRPGYKSDTPRESLAHIIYVQWVYLDAVKTGRLEFKSLGTEYYSTLKKIELLAEWERCDQAIYDFLTADNFDSSQAITVPWGGAMRAIDLLFFLRDHDILHVGWNLAMMDQLAIPRFEALAQYWG
jgi:uncharacterized damage-inducible protein DinB